MGLIKQAIGSALGANDVKNGFNGPRIPFMGNKNSDQQRQERYYSDERLPPRLGSSGLTSSSSGQYQNKKRSFPAYERKPDRSSTFQEQSFPNLDQPINSNHSRPSQNQHITSYPDSPPSYDTVGDFHSQEGWYTHSSTRSYDDQGLRTCHHQPNSLSRNRFRPLALPQIAYGDGKPFLRGYCEELQQYGISKTAFIEILDAINVAIVPNPEMQIFQKGANIAGWFLPGAASLGLMAGQFAVGIGGAFGHVAMMNRVLAKSNLGVFIPKGLEICIGSSRDLDSEVGSQTYSQVQYNASPEERLNAYGDLLAPIDEVLPEVQNNGRRDPIAIIGRGLGDQQTRKKHARAEKKLAKGKSEKMDEVEGGLKWLIVRQATDQAVNEWQKTLRQSDQDLEAVQASR